MKVLVLTSTFPRFAGDMQANFVGEQAEAWLAARPVDELVILAPHHEGSQRTEELKGIKVERFRYFLPTRWQKLAYPAIMPNIRRNPFLAAQLPFFLLSEFFAAKRIVRRMRTDLIYAHWIMPQGLVAWRVKRALGVPYILQNHSSDLSVFMKLGVAGRALAREVLRECAHFFCVNTEQKEFALSLFGGAERDEFAKRSTVLPMGIAGTPELSHSEDLGFDIATIARLSRKKGLHYLIEAAELLAIQGVRPRIAIAGDGEERSELESMVRHADITFPGFLVGGDKEAFLAAAQCFAFPSRAYKGDVEGLPVALLEALCRGRPVLASRDTNVEMLPEWSEIRDAIVFIEDPADIVALASALEQLLASDLARTRAVAPVMALYRWDKLIEGYLSPIESVLLRETGRKTG